MQQGGNQLAHAEAHRLVSRLGQRKERPQQLFEERVVVFVRLIGVALVGENDDETNQPFHRRLALRRARESDAGGGATSALHRTLDTTKAWRMKPSSSSASSAGWSRRRCASRRAYLRCTSTVIVF